MRLLERISHLTAADIAQLVEQTDEPDAALERHIREVEASILELRRAAVTAVVQRRQLAQAIATPAGPTAEQDAALRRVDGRALGLTTGMLHLERRLLIAKRQRERLAGRGPDRPGRTDDDVAPVASP